MHYVVLYPQNGDRIMTPQTLDVTSPCVLRPPPDLRDICFSDEEIRPFVRLTHAPSSKRRTSALRLL